MKKRILLVFMLIFAAVVLCGCGEAEPEGKTIEGTFVDCGSWGFMVRGDDDGVLYIFEFYYGVDFRGYSEGDPVTVTYTPCSDNENSDVRQIVQAGGLSIQHKG